VLLKYPQIINPAVEAVISGSLKIRVPDYVKFEFTRVIYTYWGLRDPILRSKYFHLALFFGFLGFLCLQKRRVSAISGVFFGLASITHPYAALGLIISTIFFFTIRLIQGERIVKRLLSVIVFFSLFFLLYFVPIVRSLFFGEPGKSALVTGTFEAGVKGPFGRTVFAYPSEVLEYFGLPLILGCLGVYEAKRAWIKSLLIPTILVIVGFLIGNAWWVFKIVESHLFNRQTIFARIGFSIFSGIYLNSLLRDLCSLKRKMLVGTIAILLIIPICISLPTRALRRMPEFSIHREEYDAIIWLRENTSPEAVVLAEPNMSKAIATVSSNRIPLGWHYYEGVAEKEERERRIEDYYSLLSSSTSALKKKMIVHKYGADFIFVPRDSAINSGLTQLFEIAYENTRIVILRGLN